MLCLTKGVGGWIFFNYHICNLGYDEKHYHICIGIVDEKNCVFLSNIIKKKNLCLIYLRFHLVQIVSYISIMHTHMLYLTDVGRGWGNEFSSNYHIHTWVMTSNINCIRHWDNGWWKLCFRCIIYKQYSCLVCLRFHLVQIASYMSTYTHTQMF